MNPCIVKINENSDILFNVQYLLLLTGGNFVFEYSGTGFHHFIGFPPTFVSSTKKLSLPFHSCSLCPSPDPRPHIEKRGNSNSFYTNVTRIVVHTFRSTIMTFLKKNLLVYSRFMYTHLHLLHLFHSVTELSYCKGNPNQNIVWEDFSSFFLGNPSKVNFFLIL